MILAQQSGTLIHLVRVFFTVIDRVVYWALMEVYNLIDQISRVNLFGESILSEFSNRIYTIIGVLMLFKLAFSIINYIVEPDKLEDSKKGFAGIVRNIIIMLALIVTVPLIFKYAMALQYVVVSDDTIGRLITGKEGATNKNVGDNMAVAILSGFIHPDSGIKEGCENWSQECEDALEKYHMKQYYHDAYFGERGYNGLLVMAASTETMGDGNYVIVYNVILSTLVGGFTTWILLMFCIDLAVRIVKLGFLQLIAPIPIVTYMDDGGQGMFKKWVTTCTKTYADLFIRLAAINFAIYIISTIIISSEGNNTLTGNFKICQWTFNDNGTLTADCSQQAGFFVKLFLILGTLMFAKQLPKMIEEITGLKLDGGFTMNPMKKLSEVPLVGGAAAAGAAIAGAGLLAGGRGLTGLAGSGISAGAHFLTKGKYGHTFGEGMSATYDKMKTRMNTGLKAAGGTWSNWRGDGKYVSPSMRNDDFKKSRQAFQDIHKKWDAGEKLRKKMIEHGFGNKPFDAFDGQNRKAYQEAYHNSQFIDSLMALDEQDAITKKYNEALFAAQSAGSAWTGTTVNGKDYSYGEDKEYKTLDNALIALKHDTETAGKTLSGLEKVHETVRGQYTEDAKTQDAMKFRKYNEMDPTRVNQ